jgi:hypothetical protein
VNFSPVLKDISLLLGAIVELAAPYRAQLCYDAKVIIFTIFTFYLLGYNLS